MIPLLSRADRLPDPDTIELKGYRSTFTLNRLVCGVDNTRCDVQLSPDFCETTNTVIHLLLKQFGNSGDVILQANDISLPPEVNDFYKKCQEVLNIALEQAKSSRERQIFFLAKVAIIKMLLESSSQCFSDFIVQLSETIWELESSVLSSRHHTTMSKEKKILNQKRKLATVKKNRSQILCQVRLILFNSFNQAQSGSIEELYQVIFGDSAQETSDLFNNLLISAGRRPDIMFMAENYLLFGNRLDDPDHYVNLVLLIKNTLKEITSRNGKPIYDDHEYDAFVKQISNFELLLNYVDTVEQYKAAKKQGEDCSTLQTLKATMERQKVLLDYFYKQFQKNDLLQLLTNFYELQPLFPKFCPPLSPHQVMQFVENIKSRSDRTGYNLRLEKFHAKRVSFSELYKKPRFFSWNNKKKKYGYVLRYIQDICRYHRDYENVTLLRLAMDHANLLTDMKNLNLSNVNNTLYSFLLAHETVFSQVEKPVINHTIVKADIRGATEIISQLQDKGLNPATYFSLNFFEPINKILAKFGAKKLFTEGDAMIISLGEREGLPGEWYSVARACGLALNILQIIQRYNKSNQNINLPPLEVGCGVCFNNKPPTYLFDGEKLILISLAINLADRMSSSAKALQDYKNHHNRMFNLYVFHEPGDRERYEGIADDYGFRFNVNGIELNQSGFDKLKKEIRLTRKIYRAPGRADEVVHIYLGSYPTTTGEIGQLAIREAAIMEMHPHTLNVSGRTGEKYYEVLDQDILMQKLQIST